VFNKQTHLEFLERHALGKTSTPNLTTAMPNESQAGEYAQNPAGPC
jgi:hypothetical protein